MAKAFLTASFLFIFLISHFGFKEVGAFPAVYNISVLLLSICCLLYPGTFSQIFLFLILGGILTLILHFKIPFMSMAPLFLLNMAVPFMIDLVKNIYKKEEGRLRKQHSRQKTYLRSLDTKRRLYRGIIEELDEEISEIAGLYELTKSMSPALKFNEIICILSDFINKNFIYKICRLLVNISDDNRGHSTLQMFDISNPSEKKQAEEFDRWIFKSVLKQKDILMFNVDEGLNNFKIRLPKDISNLTAVPIFSQNKVIGALVVSGLDETSVEKFRIVASQFALEIEKVRLYETVQNLAIIDGLTQIFVRRHFMERFEEELERSRRHKYNLTFLMIDLDHFKRCNDTYGHLVGDVVLKIIANILKKTVREIDLVARYGGEEFCILLTETGRKEAGVVAERLRSIISAQKIKAYDEQVSITISIGMATFPNDARTSQGLIRCADEALYKAKSMGRNKVVDYSELKKH